MHWIEVCEISDGYKVAVLDVAGYVVEPRVFATAEETDAWAAIPAARGRLQAG